MPTERFLSPTESVRCIKCGLPHHRLCVTLPAKGKITSTWYCPACKKRENKVDTSLKDSTMSIQNLEEEKDTISSYSSPKLHTATLGDVYNKDFTIRDVMEELRSMRFDFLDFRREMADLKIEVQSYNARIERLEARVETLEQRATELEEPVNLDKVINQLKDDLNDQEQESLANDLEIRNIPEEADENPKQLVTLVGAKLGVNIEERDIVSAERKGSFFVNSSKPDEELKPQQPRAIVVRIVRRDIRDEILCSARIQRNATLTDLGLSGKPQRFYINERLTRTNSHLFYLAREVGRQNGWQFIWTRRGRILARRKQGDPVLRVRHGKDVCDHIGPCAYTF